MLNKAKQRARLVELLGRMESGIDVAQRDLKLALSKAEFAQLSIRWAEQAELKQLEKPDAIKEYETALKQAVMAYGKYDAYSGKRDAGTKRNAKGNIIIDGLKNDSDAAFERTIEKLQEILAADPSLATWFDRTIDFTPKGDLDLAPQSVPRVITSRSLDKMRGMEETFAIKSKRQLKKELLQEALVKLDEEAARSKSGTI